MSDLYTATYNPDVLSCIANLSSDEVFTPPEVANAMLDMLPQELFSDPSSTFLDPACKSGVFLREIAKRLIAGLEDKFPVLQERIDHIFHKQLYGIAITELTSLLSRRSVYCSKYPNSVYSVSKFDDIQGNIRFKNVQHRWKNGKCVFCGASETEYGAQKRGDRLESHAYEWIHTTRPEEVFGMKFDVIIGNPPYQFNTAGDDNGAQAKPIYQHFVEQSIKLHSKYVVMITPSRWFAGGWGLDSFRNKMISCNKIKYIHDYPVSTECFSGVQIKGGVSFFLYERDYSGPCTFVSHSSKGIVSTSIRFLKEENCDVLIRDNELIKIFRKVLKVEEAFTPFSELVSGRSPFGFNTNHHGSSEKMPGYVPYYERTGYTFMDKKKITRGQENIDKYKLYISKAYGAGEGYPHQIINKPIFGPAGTICSGTFLMIGPFDSEDEMNNVYSYMCTKFFRALVAISKISQDASYKVYQSVPIQNFSIAWTDEMLYNRYGLSDGEVEFIENMIKPMEVG